MLYENRLILFEKQQCVLKQEIRVSCNISLWLALPHWRSLVRPRSGSTYEFVQDWFDLISMISVRSIYTISIPIQILTRYSKYSPSISFVHFPSLMRQGSRNRAMRNSPGSLTWFMVTGTIAPSHAWSIWPLPSQMRQPVNLWNVTPHGMDTKGTQSPNLHPTNLCRN